MYCKNCGKELSQEWVICPYCGEKVNGIYGKISVNHSSSFPNTVLFSYQTDSHGDIHTISYKVEEGYFKILNSAVIQKIQRHYRDEFIKKLNKSMKIYRSGGFVEMSCTESSFFLPPIMGKIIYDALLEFLTENHYHIRQIGQVEMRHGSINKCMAEK